MRYGLWDSRGKTWLGNAQGPLSYTEKLLARAAATSATEQLGSYILPRALPPAPFTLKDEITPLIDATTAIQRIESRAKQ